MVSVIERVVDSGSEVHLAGLVLEVKGSSNVAVVHALLYDDICLLVGYALDYLRVKAIFGEFDIILVILVVTVSLCEMES